MDLKKEIVQAVLIADIFNDNFLPFTRTNSAVSKILTDHSQIPLNNFFGCI